MEKFSLNLDWRDIFLNWVLSWNCLLKAFCTLKKWTVSQCKYMQLLIYKHWINTWSWSNYLCKHQIVFWIVCNCYIVLLIMRSYIILNVGYKSLFYRCKINGNNCEIDTWNFVLTYIWWQNNVGARSNFKILIFVYIDPCQKCIGSSGLFRCISVTN